MVLDFRWVNAQTIRDSYPLPFIQDVVCSFGGHEVFSKLDLKSGFWQVELEEDSQACTAFSHPDGQDLWRRVPFGVRNAPPHFQRAVNTMLAEQGLLEAVAAFIDDLGVGGGTHDEAANKLGKLLSALHDVHFMVGTDKKWVGYTSINFLGYRLEAGVLLPDPDRAAAIGRLLPPTTRSQLRGFLGLTGYYREFIKGYAGIARPLYQLLKENVPWEWDQAAQKAFLTLQARLAAAPILALPEPDRPFTVYSDFCGHSIAAVLE